MKKVVFTLMLLMGLIIGCSKGNDQSQDRNPNTLEIIDVSIQTPEKIDLNQEVQIQALVTQGKEKVADANEVKFELWKVGQEEHEMMKAENDGKGLYSVKKTFSEDGNYVVIAHVTARSMHSMPKKEFTVGQPVTEGNSDEHEHADETTNTEHEAAHDEHKHHDSSLVIDLTLEGTYSVNQEVTLPTTITHEGAPLLGAAVRYEIVPENSKQAKWVDAKEDGNGKYSAQTTFEQAGMYHVQVHVNKDEIHDHKLTMITVK